jgi:hypothetical protein
LNAAPSKPTAESTGERLSTAAYLPYPTGFAPNGYFAENSEALAVERNKLIQQQELEFGINMYE